MQQHSTITNKKIAQSYLLDEIFLQPSSIIIENRFTNNLNENSVCTGHCNGKCTGNLITD